MHSILRRPAALACLLLASAFAPAFAAVGTGTIAADATDGPVTLFYPTDAAPRPVVHGRFTLALAPDAAPATGNGHLVVVSHGSGGSPWVFGDLATALVDAGFVVALPEHRGDNSRDPSSPGPDSWTLRPAEISRAIDAVSRDPRFAGRLDIAHVGLYGMSAGGHTALVLAGGRWSPARFRDHCEQHIAEDFQTCVGLATSQTGGRFDGLRRRIALLVIRHLFSDDRDRAARDPRIAAIVAAVPLAADFDEASLARPVVPLAIATAGRDRWLIPRFHAERVLAACRSCEHLVDVPDGGHGAYLSPPPRGLVGIEAALLDDPPGYDRVDGTRRIDDAVVAYFRRHLMDAGR